MQAELARSGGAAATSVRRAPASLDEDVRRTLRTSRTYFASHALLLLAGLISMPLLTRLLSKTEYGFLSVILTTTSMLAVLGGLGFGDAAVRHLPGQRRRGAERGARPTASDQRRSGRAALGHRRGRRPRRRSRADHA